MDKAAACERAAKLLALADPTRGGTPAECAVAKAKAESLMAKYGLRRNDVQFAAAQTFVRQAPRESPFFGQRSGPSYTAWEFDVQTGAASSNVKVHRYDSPSSWRIEIFL